LPVVADIPQGQEAGKANGNLAVLGKWRFAKDGLDIL
jgi:hypothetical protein